jgi:hypothetical protein
MCALKSCGVHVAIIGSYYYKNYQQYCTYSNENPKGNFFFGVGGCILSGTRIIDEVASISFDLKVIDESSFGF